MVDGLLELAKVLLEFLGGEGSAIVGYELERDNTAIKTNLHEFIKGFQSLVCVEEGLADDHDVTGCVVNKDAASCVEIGVLGSPSGCEESALGGCYKVIHGDTLSWMNMLGLEDSLCVLDYHSCAAFGWPGCLLGILAGGTAGELGYGAAAAMQVPLCGGAGEDTGAHQELDFPECHVAELVVPTEKLLGCFIEVEVGFVDNGDAGPSLVPIEMGVSSPHL